MLRFSRALSTNSSLYQSVLRSFPEISFLSGSASETSESFVQNIPANSHSLEIFGKFNREFDRAWSGYLCMRNAYFGTERDYQDFTSPQGSATKLTYNSFMQMHRYTRSIIRSPEDLAVASWSVLFNDLGKYGSIQQLYRKHDKNVKENHDEILAVVLRMIPGHFIGFSSFPEMRRNELISGFGSACEIAQLVQMERPQSSLKGLETLSKNARDMYVLHSVFDVAGALGDKQPNGSLVMHEGTWTAFRLVIEALAGFDSNKTCESVYLDYARSRGKLLGISLDSNKDLALIKLSCFARFVSLGDSDLLLSAWNRLPTLYQKILESELSEDGTSGVTPILVGYAPAMIANSLGFASRQNLSKVEALRVALTHIARVFQASREDINSNHIQRPIYVGDAAEIAKALNFSLEETLDTTLCVRAAGYGSDVSFANHLKLKSSL